MNLSIPKQLDEASAFAFLASLEDAGRTSSPKTVRVDFGALRFAEPFGTLLVGCGLASFLSNPPLNV